MEITINEKLEKYLKIIVESYISSGEPVGSSNLKKNYNLDASPSTIRNIMASLEQLGYLEKSHISSGRIPSVKGYEYYAKFLANDNNEDLSTRLQDIFAKRRLSIDQTLEEAAKVISEIAGITLITTSDSSSERLRSISLTLVDNNSGVVVLITSSGKVETKTIHFNSSIEEKDVKIAIRIFNERLIDIPLNKIGQHVEMLAPILATQIKNIDAVLKTFVTEVFNFSIEYTSKIFNKNSIILSPEISREKLSNILDLIENKSIWESIEGEVNEDENLKINIQSHEASFISKKIVNETETKEITVIGSTKRMDYSAALTGLKMLENYLSKKDEKEEK